MQHAPVQQQAAWLCSYAAMQALMSSRKMRRLPRTWQARHRGRLVLCHQRHGGRGHTCHQLQPVAVAEKQLACGQGRIGGRIGQVDRWRRAGFHVKWCCLVQPQGAARCRYPTTQLISASIELRTHPSPAHTAGSPGSTHPRRGQRPAAAAGHTRAAPCCGWRRPPAKRVQ